MKIFLDCGFYVGKALDYYAPLMDETWKVYAFEPNPTLDVKSHFERYSFKVEWIKKAVWVDDKGVDFVIDDRGDAAHIDRGVQRKKVKVKTIDFSKFVADLPEAEIICSMDIEGAEFPVLRKMLDEGTMKRIQLIDIEFHDRLMKDYTIDDSRALVREMQGAGVLVKLKIPVWEDA